MDDKTEAAIDDAVQLASTTLKAIQRIPLRLDSVEYNHEVVAAKKHAREAARILSNLVVKYGDTTAIL